MHRATQSPLHLDLTLRVGCECLFLAPRETAVLVVFKPRQAQTQLLREERLHFEPALVPTEFEDDHGNIVYRMMLRQGHNLLRYDAIVKVPSTREDGFWHDGAAAPEELPPSVLRYTLPSRYADADKLKDFAWKHFGHLPNGLARVEGIRKWIHENIEYRTGSGDATLSASEVIERRYGVCRDLAHAGVALCRTFNLPARYVTGYVPDIAMNVDLLGPSDFHAYFEVFLNGCWQTFDARWIEPRIGRVKIASGYDASNCAFTTLYGSATLERFEVWTYQIDSRDASTSNPVDLRKRLDGTTTLRLHR